MHQDKNKKMNKFLYDEEIERNTEKMASAEVSYLKEKGRELLSKFNNPHTKVATAK